MDNRLLLFAHVFGEQTLIAFGLACSLFFAIWHFGRTRLRAYKIQTAGENAERPVRHEITYSILTLLANALSVTTLLCLYETGHTQLTFAPFAASWSYLAASFILMVVWNDAWFYWTHRLLHTRWMFRHIHHVHHRTTDPSPFTASSFHPVEALILCAGFWLFAFMLPVNPLLFLFFKIYAYMRNFEAHIGYEFLPAWCTKLPFFNYRVTSTFHNLHHARVHGNYAFYFRWWDKLSGTEFRDYDQVFVNRLTEDPPPAAVSYKYVRKTGATGELDRCFRSGI